MIGNNNNKELISIVLLGVSVVLAVLIVVEASSFFAASARADSQFSSLSVFAKPGEQEVQKYLADDKAVADKLRKQNLFVPLAPKENPVKEVPGIMGEEAWINGGWHKVGESIGDAKIVAIEPTQVKILWNGQETTFTPITAVGSGGSGGPGAGPGRVGEGPLRGPDMVMVAGPGGNRGPGSQGSSGNMAGMRDRLANMSEAERQAFRDQMRAQFGDRGGGGFSGRGGGGGGGGRGGGGGNGGGGGRRGGGG
jgi:hypothetical protein